MVKQGDRVSLLADRDVLGVVGATRPVLYYVRSDGGFAGPFERFGVLGLSVVWDDGRETFLHSDQVTPVGPEII